MRRASLAPRALALIAALVLVPMVASGALAAETLSKTYQFKDGVTLELGEKTGDGLRLDSVRFQLPKVLKGSKNRTGGVAGALVAVSNAGEKSLSVGVAIAMFDADGKLVAVGSGGTAMLSLKPGRQKSYVVMFDHVNARIHDAATFQITLESR